MLAAVKVIKEEAEEERAKMETAAPANPGALPGFAAGVGASAYMRFRVLIPSGRLPQQIDTERLYQRRTRLRPFTPTRPSSTG